MQLREYQSKTVGMLYDWLKENDGNPCVSLPTGSGKSVVIGYFCKEVSQSWPKTRILMLTRSQELITQNAEKLRMLWPNAPMGIYSASLGRKQRNEPITIAGPLSIVNAIDDFEPFDLCLIDEAHDISHKDEGSYRKIIAALLEKKPSMRVIGFTASPFRVGHGMITDKPAIFDGLIEPTSIMELISQGYLSVLRSKATDFKLSTEGIKKRGGEYIEKDLQAAVDTADNNRRMVDEVIARAGGRKFWMFFCTGVEHARHIKELLIERGISAEAVTGEMPKGEREAAIRDFRSGKLQAVTNVNCLSTGFDHPAIDLLVLARPTMSPGLYMQQVGRGMRPAPGKAECIVLDFAGAVAQHGPITAVKPPKKAGSGNGEAPVKACPTCSELVHISAKICPACAYEFPAPKEKDFALCHDDIMGIDALEMPVRSWWWKKHTSKASGKDMLAVTYYSEFLSDPSITEYFPVEHEGYAGGKAINQLIGILQSAGARVQQSSTEGWLGREVLNELNASSYPQLIKYKRDGKFSRVIERNWNAAP